VVNLNINWSSLTYVAGDAIKATIRALDGSGVPPTDLSWVLFRNGVQIASGSSATLNFQTSSAGLYRLRATAGGSTADSAVSVGGGFEIQASPIPPEVDPTCVYLGALYCDELTGAGGPCSTLPYQLACFTQNIYLLPGTTHISFDLDPLQNSVDDEVVVRTATGNYSITGALVEEEVGYDYLGGRPLLVAPADGILRLTVEAFNVSGAVASDFNFRVRVKCWRLGPALYQYVRCPFTTLPGGTGKRDRQFAALFTEMDVQADVDSAQNRAGTRETKTYTTPEVTTMPLTVLSTEGTPNPVQAAQGYFFTDSNCYAVYEPQDDDMAELTAKAISGQDGGLRPFYVTLQEPGEPPMIQRIKRLRGKMVVYMSQGAITKGSVINVRIVTSKSHNGEFEVRYQIPIDTDVYNNYSDVFQRLASISIDLEDFQFSDNGVVVFFSVDETNADPEPLPCDDPIPAVPDQYLYTDLLAKAVLFDGACYTNPVVQPTVAAESNPVAGGLTGCHEPVCGPVGLYCYTDMATGTRSADFRQALYNPAPYVSYGSDPFDCYHQPVFLYEITSGTAYQDTIQAQTDALCGDGWIYERCAGQTKIVTVYPHNTVPHDVINYGSECWSRESLSPVAGSVAVYIIGSLNWDIVSAGSVTAVPDCNDFSCSGSVSDGDSVFYRDTQTMQRVPVQFEGMDFGIPWVGTALQVIDSGRGARPKGQKTVTFSTPRVFLFTAGAPGQVDFNFGLADFAKRIVVIRGGVTYRHEIKIGQSERIVTLQAGDQVYADIGNAIGILSDRTRNKRTTIRWRPIVILPRVFDTVTLAATGANTITALGFTGITTRSPYTLMSPLPKDLEQDLPNPDNIVTVQAATGPEYVLVRTRAYGDPVPQLPGNTQWYAGESLSGELTFRFYTTREEQGAHGEMDVWLSNEDGHFPIYFRVDPYRTLGLVGGELDVLLLLSFDTVQAQEALRSSIAVFHQRFLDLGITPRYGVIIISAPPNTGVMGNDFLTYEELVSDSYWESSVVFGSNIGSFESGMTTVWTAGTAMDWTPGARRVMVAITPYSAWDYPPGYVAAGSTENLTKALTMLANDDVLYYGIVNQNATVPINFFTFTLPSNVPQTQNVLAAASGGKIYAFNTWGTDPNPIMEDIANSAQTMAFVTRTTSEITDVSRNSLRIAQSGTEFAWPNVYVSEEGERISILSSTGTILYNDTVFVLVGPDSGISSQVLNPNGVVNYATAWFTTDHMLWETTDGETWTLD
jgi:hypothetical protein